MGHPPYPDLAKKSTSNIIAKRPSAAELSRDVYDPGEAAANLQSALLHSISIPQPAEAKAASATSFVQSAASMHPPAGMPAPPLLGMSMPQVPVNDSEADVGAPTATASTPTAAPPLPGAAPGPSEDKLLLASHLKPATAARRPAAPPAAPATHQQGPQHHHQNQQGPPLLQLVP